jgi:hypothetical protein
MSLTSRRIDRTGVSLPCFSLFFPAGSLGDPESRGIRRRYLPYSLVAATMRSLELVGSKGDLQ